MQKHRRYLVVFVLAKPRHEHGELKNDIAKYSDGNLEPAFFSVNADGAATIGYFFTSSLPPSEMTFDGHLLREDSYLLTEVSHLAGFQGFDGSASWWKKPVPWDELHTAPL